MGGGSKSFTMARLITKHDPYHLHKTLGAAVLLHFGYRFYLLLTQGTAFPPYESRTWQSIGVGAHAALSLSSLLLPLPEHRNFSSPMIWPEFRLHSILFALRHVVCTLLTIHDAWPEGLLANAASKFGIIMATSFAARAVTERWGNRQTRTTNAMPYPPGVTEAERDWIKKIYALAQFGATTQAIYPDATVSFGPILAIQIAPLMMTLVRKGKASAAAYHGVYIVALTLSGIVVPLRLLVLPEMDVLRMMIAIRCIPSSLRMHYRLPIATCWLAHIVAIWVLWPLVAHRFAPCAPYALPLTLGYAAFLVVRMIRAGYPIFLNTISANDDAAPHQKIIS